MKRLFVLIILVLLFAPGAMAYDEVRTLEIPVDSSANLKVEAGAGFLHIAGVEGLKNIEVVAKIQIDHLNDVKKAKEYLSRVLKLTLEKFGNRCILTSQIQQSNMLLSWFGEKQYNSRVNLFVKVPTNISVHIDDGSGDLQISNLIGNVAIDDGSGHISIQNVFGNVKVDDGSGDIYIHRISGDVEIDDGSGKIVVVEITGSVTVTDGSDSIEIDNVEQDVIILEAGTGSVVLKNIQGRIEEL